jgi:ribonuclease E
MTPEEQSVYAMMGISPLVLSHKTVKDPKNTIVKVVLPGENIPAEELGAVAGGNGDEDVTAAAASPDVAPPEVDFAAADGSADPEVMDLSSTPENLPPEESDEESAEEAEAEETGAPKRRRRRRSSASSTDDVSVS